MSGVYTRRLVGHSVVATDAPSRHRRGVAVLYRLTSMYVVDAIQKFRPNTVGFQLATGGRRCYIIGCYLAPDNTSII